MAGDLPDWIKELVEIAGKKGHVTFDDINTVWPPDRFGSEQIEDGMHMLAALEITIVDEASSRDEIRYEDACIRGARRLELAIAALRHGKARHARQLMETTIAELKLFEQA